MAVRFVFQLESEWRSGGDDIDGVNLPCEWDFYDWDEGKEDDIGNGEKRSDKEDDEEDKAEGEVEE